MIYTCINLVNVFTLFAIIAFLIFLYKKIDKESGKWTAFLVFLIAMTNVSFPTQSFENDKEYTVYNSQCQDCVIKANYRFETNQNIGLLNSVNTQCEIYMSENEDDEIILLKKNTSLLGLKSNISFGSSHVHLKRGDGNKVYCRETVLSRAKIFLLFTWSDRFYVERESELIPI